MGKQAQITRDFMIFARLESLIAGFGVEDALDRARTYLNSGSRWYYDTQQRKERRRYF